MEIVAREMVAGEINIVIDYFHSSTPEHLEMLGVDPTRLPPKQVWKDRFRQLFATPIEARSGFYVTWLADNRVVGFSSCDKMSLAIGQICIFTSRSLNIGNVGSGRNACSKPWRSTSGN
jgi:hypothetical protein